MTLDDVTVCMGVRNAADAVSLTWESFLAHHGPMRLHVRDDASFDGAGERLRPLAQSYVRHELPIDHGPTLDALVKEVTTPLTLILDSDVEFLTKFVPAMISVLQQKRAFCVAPSQLPRGTADQHGMTLSGHPRIEPYCTLFYTAELNRLLRWFSFSVQIDMGRKLYLDTGAAIWQAAQAAGLKIVECNWIWHNIVHFGGLSTSALEADHPRQAAYETVGRRLTALRRGQQTTDGLAWDGNSWRP